MAKQRLAAIYRRGVPVEVVEMAQEYEQLKEAIGGYIEHVTVHPGVDMWCDEEGVVKQLPPTVIVRGERYVGPISGPAVFFVTRAATAEALLRKLEPIVIKLGKDTPVEAPVERPAPMTVGAVLADKLSR